MWTKNSIWLFVAAVVIIPVSIFAGIKWYEISFTKLPVLGEKGHAIADFNFVNQHGNAVTTADWKGKIVVADFFFTRCPSICPKMTYNLKRVQAYAGENILINSFTVDPEWDNEKQLKKYADKFSIKENWMLLTGDKKEIYRLARNSFMIVATDGDGGPQDFIHSEQLVLIDKQKRIRGFYSGTDEDEVNNLVRDIKRLQNEK